MDHTKDWSYSVFISYNLVYVDLLWKITAFWYLLSTKQSANCARHIESVWVHYCLIHSPGNIRDKAHVLVIVFFLHSFCTSVVSLFATVFTEMTLAHLHGTHTHTPFNMISRTSPSRRQSFGNNNFAVCGCHFSETTNTPPTRGRKPLDRHTTNWGEGTLCARWKSENTPGLPTPLDGWRP